MADLKQTRPSTISVKIAEHFGLAACAVFLMVLALGYVFLFAPALHKAQDANKTQQLEREITAKKSYLVDLRQLKANYDKIPADDVEKIRAMIPFEDDLPGLAADFEALAKQNDVDMTSIGFSGGIGTGVVSAVAAVPSGLEVITINLSLQHADYTRIRNFIQTLERHIRIFDIQSMNLNPSAAQYVISLKTYVHRPVGN